MGKGSNGNQFKAGELIILKQRRGGKMVKHIFPKTEGKLD